MDTSNLLHLFNQKQRILMREINEWLKPFDLYSSQWTILYTLHQNGRMTQTEIWQNLKVEAPTITRTLVRMEKSGWVTRQVGTDKRERVVQLTEMAIDKFPEIFRQIKKGESKFLENLSEEELSLFKELLDKLTIERDG
ncbi:DNA-binding transcriptional regulator, MarR family [Gracilibacillus ureilyticus]|uniref:DNA-binding transcriptional regulator, MarR family n=1 Tax=Gracilibacillus ureilyticus TaxID=531814 RepID=A0A1H9S0G6_9BACI|nr:MarR family transcriptional regulator [Gracilibacillus ureilyticus]SER78115.1 DNA-binding transcriptional regulator, MarR family [Gracilibacillus ureilyticus]